MLTLRLRDVADWTDGVLQGADAICSSVFTDSRAPQPGGLFVALRGERFDAHEFVAAAMDAGAAAALVMRPLPLDLPQVVVDDTTRALGRLASAVRAQRRARVIGITGSNGKTTVKTLLASILTLQGKTHANPGNRNNEIGLPLSVLAMPEDTEYAVLEMGAGKRGDIAYLAAIARPSIGLVNNIAPAHLERLGSLEGIAETKGALYQALPADGVVLINADDAFAGYFAELAGGRRMLRFGLAQPAEVRGTDLVLGASSRFRLVTPAGEMAVSLPLSGRHNVLNALAAAAVAHVLEVPLATIRQGLESAAVVPGRLERHAMPGGWILIDDSYNANPGSTAAAIATLATEPGEPWLVLGDMRELGPRAAVLHAEIGALARRERVARLFTVGEFAAAAAEAFGHGARHFPDSASLAAALAGEVRAGVCVLVKGSRGSAMERVVEALRERFAGDPRGASHAA
jgi:UDP-N-acetylmuramoyl-tripeptide--D-alanyl-D-alanine ligase